MEEKNIESYFKNLHARILKEVEKLQGSKSVQDHWKNNLGSGLSCVWEKEKQLIEKGAVNFSAVGGKIPKLLKSHFSSKAKHFHATGISVILHPKNPFQPIIHMNLRYLKEQEGKYWFGGGIDLSPYYIDEEEAIIFHQALQNYCEILGPHTYNQFKDQADEYFFLPHRQETRGIGGIFFDHLSAEKEKIEFKVLLNFIQTLGESFMPLYSQLLTRNLNKPYGKQELHWQQIRRGRYIEFNLIYDRGTQFGFQSKGRTESILSSLPPTAKWLYNYIPPKGSPEYLTLEKLKKGIPWSSFSSPGS
ncbi:MAG: oxygen-dependent coproporphyrinogen oxidase [Cytophagales bacterium]|nr:oxygen-dependent coproporphyrinogen oxidase [Cytophagales bacterium]